MNKLANINNSKESFQALIDLYENNKDVFFDKVELLMHTWFSANMSAALGAVLDKIELNFNSIQFLYIDETIERILKKNDFLTFFGYPSEFDNNHTTIRYLKLKPTDGKYFKDYIFKELLGRTELPKMTKAAKDKIAIAIYEIFVNAQIHSESQNIYTCGQFFPQKDKIEFTIVDTGVGFKHKVNTRFNKQLNAVQAIQWAVKDKNTTKIDISGGIGLALLREFISMNMGKMQIVSYEGYYEYSTSGEETHLFNGAFPGTIVNLQFRTNDANTYYLEKELNANDIF